MTVWIPAAPPDRQRGGCASGLPASGSGPLDAGWLSGVVEHLLLAYTRPGDILHLIPAMNHRAPRSSQVARTSARRHRHQPAARIAHRATPTANPRSRAAPLTDDSAWQGHVQARAAAHHRQVRVPTNPMTGTWHGTASGGQPGATAILAVLDPHRLHWFEQAPWRLLMQPGGILAALTHSDRDGGRLVDPTTPLIHAAHNGGLNWLDHIIIPHRPMRPALPRAGGHAERAGTADGSCRAGSTPARPGHCDLLIFLAPPSPDRHAPAAQSNCAQ
jgi:hypothetical protein